MKRIRIHVTKDGVITVLPSGFAGPECHAAAGPIEEALGSTLGSEPTPDAFVAGNETYQDNQ